MAIPKKKKKSLLIPQEKKSILVAANQDTGFKSYMSDNLTSNEFESFLKDPERRHLVIDAYKKYLKQLKNKDGKIRF